MEQKEFVLNNRGMNRDLSISKTGQATAYDNHNIRILARDNDTLLSVTNERGNAEISLKAGSAALDGDLIGWNVLNNHVILFTTASGTDRIYRIDYDATAVSAQQFTNTLLFSGSLGFSTSHPIESVVYYETEDIQKIYWVDGIHPLRMMNFMTDADFRSHRWGNDYFDTNRGVTYSLSVDITKDNSGNTRPNGVMQYLITYYNKYGQETGYVWTSDLVYLSPSRNGGSPDETNNNKVVLKISGIENATIGGETHPRYTNIRIYSIFRSSYKGQAVGYVVADFNTDSATNGEITVIDDGAHLEVIDVTKLLFLGSRDAKIGTMAYKEQTLFLGDIQLNESPNTIETAIHNNMFILSNGSFVDGVTWEAKTLTDVSGSVGIAFMYSSGTTGDTKSIPLVDSDEVYSYTMQLSGTSSEISGFKGGEKYRFGLRFRKPSGEDSEVFWIGDKVNHLYPVIDHTNDCINRVVVKCVIHSAVISTAAAAGYSVVQLMYAEATYADRSVKAQGVINPTVFNVWNRYKGRIYAMPSWTSRPRNAEFAWKHFDVVHNLGDSTAEIECNYWDTEKAPVPYYQLTGYGTEDESYSGEESGSTDYNYGMLIYCIGSASGSIFEVSACGVLVKTKYGSITPIINYEFESTNFPQYSSSRKSTTITDGTIDTRTTQVFRFTWDKRQGSFSDINNEIKKIIPEISQDVIDIDTFEALLAYAAANPATLNYWTTKFINPSTDAKASYAAAANYNPSDDVTERWTILTEGSGSDSIGYSPSYNKKHLMFVDENIVTLDSPEITYESSLMDNVEGYKLRIVGVAPVSGRISDVSVDATRGDFVGENLANDKFSGSASSEDKTGLLAWPLWREHGLQSKADSEREKKKRTAEDYFKGSNVVNYWLYLWSKSDIIDGFTDEDVTVFDGDAYSRIKRKVIGNLRFAKDTVYNQTWANMWVSGDVQTRLFNYTHSQYVGLDVDDTSVYYDGFIDDVLTVPANFKYPILYSTGAYDKDSISNGTTNMSLYTNSPVRISYASNPHVVLRFPSSHDDSTKLYKQQVLPYFASGDYPTVPERDVDNNVSGALAPWIKQDKNIVFIKWNISYPNSFVIAGREADSLTLYAYYDETSSDNFVKNFWDVARAYYPGMPIYIWVKSQASGLEGYYLVDITSGEETITPESGGASQSTYVNYHLRNAKIGYEYHNSGENYVFVDAVQFTGIDSAPSEKGTKKLNMYTGDWVSLGENDYPYVDYAVDTTPDTLDFNFGSYEFDKTQPYFLIGEIFYDYDGGSVANDTRYGGITKSAIENCKFIPAGPMYKMASGALTVYGNDGDTYFQRWDDLRIKPIPGNSPNNVTDIVSAMVETHINLDGRYDHQRGSRYLASLDIEHFGQINQVYSQPNDFFSGRDLDRDYDFNTYRSAITWTLEKHDAERIDEWTHVTLASTLKLDGDKGACNALRRYRNSIMAFQDRCLSEILFNSRTQIPTGDGIPIEISNSGKVDGKNTISDKYGCINKWSIVEGKTGLYFVDNTNKIFAGFDGASVKNISGPKGFGVWFRDRNKMIPWNPYDFNNLVAYYDRIHSDIYLVGSSDAVTGQSCLVYNEALEEFTSFFDYGGVPMMANVQDRFISFHKNGSNVNKLWLQNEGLYYCNFFGTQYNYWTEHRVAPNPYSDKIWTGIEYRADFYNGITSVAESNFDIESYYVPGVTFDKFRAWNEYQSTPETTITQGLNDSYADVRKKFRIWRLDIPRATKDSTYNKNGLNRIRNPWVRFRLTKDLVNASNTRRQDLMQLHDIIVNYFE